MNELTVILHFPLKKKAMAVTVILIFGNTELLIWMLVLKYFLENVVVGWEPSKLC